MPHLANEITDDIVATAAERFWPNVDVRNDDECWLWKGRRSKAGYGILSVHGRIWVASRLSLAINGVIPPRELQACHHCDNPPCVNPAHLFLGTSADNTNDRLQKGRVLLRKGENNPRAKVTAEQVLAIRSHPFGHKRMAKLLGLGRTTIRDIRSGRNWGHVA